MFLDNLPPDKITTRKQWLEARKNGIGASEAAAILGHGYKSSDELWNEKTGRTQAVDISDKSYVKFGTEAEKHIRALFELENPDYLMNYKEFEIIRNPDYPFIFATPDGILQERDGPRSGVWECKTTEILNPSQWKKWDEGVPQHYYIQILHQLLATEYSFAILTARIRYTNKHGDKVSQTRDYRFERTETVEADIKYLLKEEIKFWEHIQGGTQPPLKLPEI